MSTKKSYLLITLVIFLVTSSVFFYFIYNEPLAKNLEKVSSDVSLKSNKLVASFVSDEESSNKLYTGKIIEVEGFIKEISFLNDRETLILSSNSDNYGIICDLHTSQIEKMKTLKINQKIKVKGICKGFLKDVILLNCYLDLEPNE